MREETQGWVFHPRSEPCGHETHVQFESEEQERLFFETRARAIREREERAQQREQFRKSGKFRQA